MKIPILLLSAILGAPPPLPPGIKSEVIAVTKEEIAQKKIPITCEIVRKADGDLLLKLTLKEPFEVSGTFNAYELRVLKKPFSIPELTKKEYFNLDLIVRRARSREKTAEFQLKKDEIGNAYIVIESWDGKEEGMSKLRSVCLSVSAMVEK